jgi:hypothetical protein
MNMDIKNEENMNVIISRAERERRTTNVKGLGFEFYKECLEKLNNHLPKR